MSDWYDKFLFWFPNLDYNFLWSIPLVKFVDYLEESVNLLSLNIPSLYILYFDLYPKFTAEKGLTVWKLDSKLG
jgi:hypothetical protein